MLGHHRSTNRETGHCGARQTVFSDAKSYRSSSPRVVIASEQSVAPDSGLQATTPVLLTTGIEDSESTGIWRLRLGRWEKLRWLRTAKQQMAQNQLLERTDWPGYLSRCCWTLSRVHPNSPGVWLFAHDSESRREQLTKEARAICPHPKYSRMTRERAPCSICFPTPRLTHRKSSYVPASQRMKQVTCDMCSVPRMTHSRCSTHSSSWGPTKWSF